MVALDADFGIMVVRKFWTVSEGAKEEIMSRDEYGDVRHLEMPTLWVQKTLFLLHKIASHAHCAELGTKQADVPTHVEHGPRHLQGFV